MALEQSLLNFPINVEGSFKRERGGNYSTTNSSPLTGQPIDNALPYVDSLRTLSPNMARL